MWGQHGMVEGAGWWCLRTSLGLLHLHLLIPRTGVLRSTSDACCEIRFDIQCLARVTVRFPPDTYWCSVFYLPLWVQLWPFPRHPEVYTEKSSGCVCLFSAARRFVSTPWQQAFGKLTVLSSWPSANWMSSPEKSIFVENKTGGEGRCFLSLGSEEDIVWGKGGNKMVESRVSALWNLALGLLLSHQRPS